jgi:hypothetical protein
MTYAKEGRGEHYGEKMMGDGWQIPLVLALRRRTANGRHQCPCDECRAIKQVCALASERLVMPSDRRRVARARKQHAVLKAAVRAFLAGEDGAADTLLTLVAHPPRGTPDGGAA